MCETKRLNLFEEVFADTNTSPEKELIKEELNTLFDTSRKSINDVKIYSGLLPNIFGECNSIVNKALTIRDINLTNIGKGFYTEKLLEGLPKDNISKEVYASVMNQLVAYNILNSVEEMLFGSCGLELNTEGTPRWYNGKTVVEIITYCLRERSINTFVVKDDGKDSIFLETHQSGLANANSVKAIVEYIKNLVLKNKNHDAYHTMEIRVNDIISKINRTVFIEKVDKYMERIYDSEDLVTELEAAIEDAKIIKKLDSFEDKLKEGYNTTYKLLNICGKTLQKVDKYTSHIESAINLSSLSKACSSIIGMDYITATSCLENCINLPSEYIGEEDKETILVYVEHGLEKMANTISKFVVDYKNSYRKLDMDISVDEHIGYSVDGDLG